MLSKKTLIDLPSLEILLAANRPNGIKVNRMMAVTGLDKDGVNNRLRRLRQYEEIEREQLPAKGNQTNPPFAYFRPDTISIEEINSAISEIKKSSKPEIIHIPATTPTLNLPTLPPFDPSWSKEVQEKWIIAYERLTSMIYLFRK